MTLHRSRWIAPSLTALIVGLSACGSTMTSSSADGGSGTAAPLSPRVIHVAAGGFAPAPAAAGAATAEADTKLAWIGGVNYVYDGTPPDLTPPATSWFFSADQQPSTDQIAAIANALGVAGDVTALPADRGGGWLVGPNDYSKPTLSVGSDAMHMWFYSAPAPADATVSSGGCAGVAVPDVPPPDYPGADPAAGEPSSAATEPISIEPPNCTFEEPKPPTGVPSAQEAEAKARPLFESIGIDLSSYEVEPYADEWSASVTFTLMLDGVRSNVAMSVGYGAEGALTWASGFLGTPQRSADYERIGVLAAIERMNSQSPMWMGYGGVLMDAARSNAAIEGVPAVAPGEPAPSESAPTQSYADPGTMPPIDPALPTEPTPVDQPIPTVPPEPMTITLTNARPSLEQLWADDGTIWLLPGYAFDSTDGGIYTVIAVPDEFIQVSQPTEQPSPPLDATVEPPVDATIRPETPVAETTAPPVEMTPTS